VARTDDSISKFKLDVAKYHSHTSGRLMCNRQAGEEPHNLYERCNKHDETFGDYACIPEAKYMLLGEFIKENECTDAPFRYQLIEFNLFTENHDLGDVPLGWTLSTSSVQKIRKIAKQQVLDQKALLASTEGYL
jgi:hypothetical protein